MVVPAPRDFTITYKRKEQIARDTYSFYFERTEGDFDFLPGQYLRMMLPHENHDIRGKSRLFSIASSPLDTNQLIITTKIVMSSFKKTLFDLSYGSEVQCFGPIGRFVLDELESRPHIFLAGGIGITPFHSMIQFAHAKDLSIPLFLFASFPNNEDLIYFKDFEELTGKNSNVKIIYTLTRQKSSESNWQGETGRINPAMIKRFCPNFADAIFYICGNYDMVNEVITMVQGMGIQPENIRKEHFVGY